MYFNSGTVPGERNRVYMEWIEPVIDSTYRSGAVPSPERAQDLYAKVRELTVDSWIEFYELMSHRLFIPSTPTLFHAGMSVGELRSIWYSKPKRLSHWSAVRKPFRRLLKGRQRFRPARQRQGSNHEPH